MVLSLRDWLILRGRLRRFVAVTTLPLVVGCAIDPLADDADEEDPTAADTQALSIRNPVQTKCADPAVMKDGATYYLTCTGGDGKGNIYPIYSSTNHLDWKRFGEVFTKATAPKWADGNWWAPELHHHKDGFVVVFSAKNKATGHNAVGIAFTKDLKGGFTDTMGKPLVQHPDRSAIDAHLIHDDDQKPILYYKSERFNDGAQADLIRAVRLSDDAKAFDGEPKTILPSGEKWEGGVVEGPWVHKRGEFYYLFYSGNAYCNASYAVGVARSKSPFGPFEKKGAPILKSGQRWVAPGHNAIATGPDGRTWIVYHAYKLSEGIPRCGEPVKDNDTRHTLVDRVVWQAGWPKVVSNL